MDLKSKKILIAGAGISGIGAAALLGKAGIPAAIYDGNEALDQKAVVAKLPEGMEVSFELGEFKEELADKYDMLILSPGISIHQPVAQAFYVKNKPVWGEIELASHVNLRLLALQVLTVRQQLQHSSERSWEMPVNLYLL